MLAKLYFEKIIVRGVKRFKLLYTEGILSEDELPQDYMDSVPRFRKSDSGAYIYIVIPLVKDSDLGPFTADHGNADMWLTVGKTYSQKDVDIIITWLRRAGNRLTKINRRLKEENEGWEGQVEITI